MSQMLELPALLTVAEVAHVLRVSDETVRRRIADGAIRAVRLGSVNRIPVAELERVLDDNATTKEQRR